MADDAVGGILAAAALIAAAIVIVGIVQAAV